MSVLVEPYHRHGVQLDQIVVEGIKAEGKHGVSATERATSQAFVVDVVVHVDTRVAAREDALAQTVDYGVMAEVAASKVSGETCDLIETLAERIAVGILEATEAFAVDVIIHKPRASISTPFGDIYVAIRRDLSGRNLWVDKRIGSAAGLADDPRSPEAVPPPRDHLDERPAKPVPVLLAIGGNLGDVEYTLARAVEDLGRVEGIRTLAVSPLVATKPVGGPDQPDFLNAVVRAETTLAARALLHVCQGIEMIHGREREVRDGPRTLDIDLVVYGDVTGVTDDLVLPHPRAHERAFVLAPWAAIEPQAKLPASASAPGGAVADLAAAAADAAGLQVMRNPWDPAAVIVARTTPPGTPPAGA